MNLSNNLINFFKMKNVKFYRILDRYKKIILKHFLMFQNIYNNKISFKIMFGLIQTFELFLTIEKYFKFFIEMNLTIYHKIN